MRSAWAVLLAASVALADQPRRPAVDLSAMREAMGVQPDESGTPYPSAASYAHYLRARLAHHDGNHRVALDELRLALASDDQNAHLMTELAEEYARGSELDRAEAQLKKVLERSPDYQPAQLLMGRVLFEEQKTTRARTHLVKAIKLRPHEPDAYLVLTQLWLDANRVDDATRVVDELGAALPGEPIGYRRLGLALAERNDPRAERLLQRAVERDPGDVESWGSLARIAENAGQLPRALESFERALERDPENREVLLNAGRLALRLHRTADARAYLDEALGQGQDPELAVRVSFIYLAAHQLSLAGRVLDDARRSGVEPRLHYYAGLVHERAREFKQAAEAFQAVPAGLGEISDEARLHRGMCLSQLGQHAQALETLRTLQVDKPSLLGLEPALARALERAGQPQDGETLLVKSLARGPSVEVLEALSGFYGRHGRLGDAVALLSGALARSPRDEAITAALANAYERTGQWRRAVEQMRSLLELDPANATALNFIGYTLAQNGGDLDEAEKAVRRALESRPDSAAYMDSLGMVLLKRNKVEEANVVLERAVEGGSEDATVYEHLGEAALKAGKKQRAHECFTRALELVTGNPDDAERPTQRAELERKLKLLSVEQQRR